MVHLSFCVWGYEVEEVLWYIGVGATYKVFDFMTTGATLIMGKENGQSMDNGRLKDT